MSASASRVPLSTPPAPSLVGKRWDSLFSALLLACAILVLWLARTYSPGVIKPWVRPVPLRSPDDVLLLLAALLLAVLVHEGGHLIAAIGLDFRILGLSVGPLTIQFLHGQWKASWWWSTFFTGSVSAVPSTMSHWREAMMGVVIAGPLATLGACIAAVNMHADGHAEVQFQIAFVQVSLLLFLLGLIPNGRRSRTPNDARLMIDLIQKNQGAVELELKVLLKQQVLAGIRPNDYPKDLIQRLTAWRGRPESELAFAQAVALWALDSDETSLAEAWDAHALEISARCSKRLRNSALASSGCVDVLVREDLESARAKFAQVNFDSLFPTCFEYRCRAAQQIAIGRLHRAPAHIIRAQYSLPPGIECYHMERMLIEKLHMRVLMPNEFGREKTKAASA